MHDRDTPFGRGRQARPYTQHEYAERFNKLGSNGEHWYNYPGNWGAKPGSRVAFTDASQFARYYGTQFDRIGGEDGRCLAVVRNGVPASWEQRSLHVGLLRQPYRRYSLSGLPEAWWIEASVIAPAIGQPGGALQVRIFDETSEAWRVSDLVLMGVLRR